MAKSLLCSDMTIGKLQSCLPYTNYYFVLLATQYEQGKMVAMDVMGHVHLRLVELCLGL